MRTDYKKDLHAILGVSEKAGPEELRKAYLNLAVKYHPDRNPGDAEAEERFKDISQAYAILSDPAARVRYERLRPKKAARPEPKPAQGAGTKARPASSSAKSSAGPQAKTDNTARKGAGTSGAESRKKPTGPEAAQAGTKAKPESEPKPAPEKEPKPETGDGDFDDVLSGFFKSDKGRETLRDLEGELSKAGIKFKAEDFAEWVRQKQKPPKAAAPDNRSFMEKLASWLPGAEARARKKAERYDISYQITLPPQTAQTGTTVEISYQRDESPRRLSIKIPAGIKDGAKLRLSGQGRLKPEGERGDLILTVQVTQPLTLHDLWKK